MFAPCPNSTCEHLAALHDVYDDEDPYPTCCYGDCRCGHPGEVVLTQHDNRTLEVVSADPVIRVSTELLDQLADDGSSQWDPDTMVLLLDTAGSRRYEYLRPDPTAEKVAIFGRVKP